MIRFDETPVGLGNTRHAPASGTRVDGNEEGVMLLAGHGRNAASLSSALEERGFRVVAVPRFEAALREVGRMRFDTILVGSDPEAGDHLSFLEELASRAGDVLRIALARCTDAIATERALAAGAHDVVCPPHSARAITFRRQVLQRAHGRAPMAVGRLHRRVALGHLVVDLASRQVLDGADPLTLSGREFELLIRLMEARGEVVQREELLHDIWGGEQGSEAVLDATVHRLRRKLDEKLPEADVVTTVRGVGYRLEAPVLAGAGVDEQG
jgi:DNA-binding response OmpR family regulator